MKIGICRGLALATVLLFAGCKFEHPLTSGPSKGINSWLLGVWETKTPEGTLQQVTLTPKSGERYWVKGRRTKSGGATSGTWEGEAWISRVGTANFLTIHVTGGSDAMQGAPYVFVHFQVLDQNRVRTRIPELESDASASGFELRREVRRGLKSQALLNGPPLDWTRTSEVYWSGSNEPQPWQPLRNPEKPSQKPRE